MEQTSRIYFKQFITLSLFLFLITPVLNLNLPIYIRTPDIMLGVIFSFLYLINLSRKITKNELILILFSYILLLYSLALEVIYNYQGYDFTILLIRSFITTFSAFYLARIISGFKDPKAYLSNVIIFLCILQGAVLLFSFISVDVRNFFDIFFYRLDDKNLEHLIQLRAPGFVETGGDGLSINHAALSIVALYLAKVYKKSKLVISVIFLSGLSTVVTGRSGFVLFAIFGLLTLISLNENGISLKRIIYFILIFFLIIFIFYAFRIQIGNYAVDLISSYGYEHPIARALKGFASLVQTGRFEVDIVQNLFGEHLNFPNDNLVWLFGNNSYSRADGYDIKVDIGWIRLIHTIGIFGLLIYVLKFLFLFFESKQYKSLIFILIFLSFLANFNIPYSYSRIFIFLLILIFLIFTNDTFNRTRLR